QSNSECLETGHARPDLREGTRAVVLQPAQLINSAHNVKSAVSIHVGPEQPTKVRTAKRRPVNGDFGERRRRSAAVAKEPREDGVTVEKQIQVAVPVEVRGSRTRSHDALRQFDSGAERAVAAIDVYLRRGDQQVKQSVAVEVTPQRL